MIQAYATGTPIEISPLNGDGAGGIVGYARPGGPHDGARWPPERSCRVVGDRGLVGRGGGDDGPAPRSAPVLASSGRLLSGAGCRADRERLGPVRCARGDLHAVPVVAGRRKARRARGAGGEHPQAVRLPAPRLPAPPDPQPEVRRRGGRAGLLLALAHGHTPPAAATASTVVPDGNTYTPSSWAAALLSAGGWPQTRCNLSAVTAWEQAEGGNWQNSAAYNPLNTTYDDNGRWEAQGLVTATINSAGVRAYSSWQTGFTATLTTLGNGQLRPDPVRPELRRERPGGRRCRRRFPVGDQPISGELLSPAHPGHPKGSPALVNKPEIIALIIIGLTLFLLVKYTAVQAWHVLVILVAGFFLAVYVPQIPGLISSVAGWLSSHATSLTHH